MLDLDWQSLFSFNVSVAELVMRGTLMFWFLFLMFRFVIRRDVGAIGISDIMLLVIIADAAQNAMSGSYDTVAEGMVVVGTLVAWNQAIDWANYRFKWFRKFAEPRPLMLIRDGRLVHRNLQRESLSEEELLSKLREQSVDGPEEVRWAYLESDGQISIRRYADEAQKRTADKAPPPRH